MGWLRKRRRNHLKNELLQEGKLNQYATKFERQIKRLDDQIRVFDVKAKDAYTAKDDYETRMNIYQVRELKKLRADIQKLLTFLQKAAVKKDAQDMYQEFLHQLDQFKDAYRSDKGKKRKERRTVRKYKREVGSLDSQLEWIDKKVDKVDKSMDRKENITDKSLAQIDVEAYMNDHE